MQPDEMEARLKRLEDALGLPKWERPRAAAPPQSNYTLGGRAPSLTLGTSSDDGLRQGLLKLVEEREIYRQQIRDWESDPAKKRTNYRPPCFSSLSFTEGLIQDKLQLLVDHGIELPELPSDIQIPESTKRRAGSR